MLYWKLLHIISVFFAFGLALGSEVLLHRVAQTGDVKTIRNTFRIAKPIAMAVPLLFITGVVFGVIAATAGGFNLLAPWLLLSYVVFVIGMALGGAVGGSWQKDVVRAAATSPDDKPSPELAALLHDRRSSIAMYGGAIALAILIALMVLKPFS